MGLGADSALPSGRSSASLLTPSQKKDFMTKDSHDNPCLHDAYWKFRRDLRATVRAIALSEKDLTERLRDAYFQHLAGSDMPDVPDELFVEFRQLREDLASENDARALPPEKAGELICVLVDLAVQLAPEYPDEEDD